MLSSVVFTLMSCYSIVNLGIAIGAWFFHKSMKILPRIILFERNLAQPQKYLFPLEILGYTVFSVCFLVVYAYL